MFLLVDKLASSVVFSMHATDVSVFAGGGLLPG
jgi:hypothetical protein